MQQWKGESGKYASIIVEGISWKS